MRLDGPFSCSQFGGDLFVEQTGGYEREDFALAGSKRTPELLESGPLELLSAPFAREIGAAFYRIQQRSFVNRLFKEIHGAFPHRMHSK